MSNPIVKGSVTEDTISVHIDLYQYPVRYIKTYLGQELVGTFHPMSDFHLRNEKGFPLRVELVFSDGNRYETTIAGGQIQREEDRNFLPGDILVACDNFGDFLPPGYMGHSAMVLDEKHIIEAVTTYPQVRKATIQEFKEIHPLHLQLRCKDREAALNATEFANNYLQIYTENLNQNKEVPPFSFTTQVALDDPWTAIYCSKLIWLSYYYGADMELENDYFLFSPEDLSMLEYDERFEVIYKHPDFQFNIDL
ncbi:hypothetical protein [Tenuibacillus multivorans]|uniref:Uncharacterized protein n=1 Tax=Tenuibacillus multivorans TaxID=237069 RepID=A0A1G9WEF1_9BACI|nr:hypothetical protein [Tenuibacillus multivorans]GEL76418.1 hypothetical protein TMU01_06530 [Tenuibacillus multivorans]SDM82677.1 hypothetical protein SAMN05216498_0707 [Tenuibacillus multivorans]